MQQQDQETGYIQPTAQQKPRLRSPFSSAAFPSASPFSASYPHQHVDVLAQQRPAMLGHTRRSRSESAIILGARRETGRARAGTEAAAERQGLAGRASWGGGEEQRQESNAMYQSRKRRASDVEEEGKDEREQEAARILATGLNPRSVRPTSAVRGEGGRSSDEEIKPRVVEVDYSPEDEARSLLRRYTVASPSPLRKRAKVEDGGALRGKMSSPLRYGGSDEAGSGLLNHPNLPPPPTIHSNTPLRPLLFPPAPQPTPSFIFARLGSSEKDDQSPPSSSSSLAPLLVLQAPSDLPSRPLQFDPLPPMRTSRRLTPQPNYVAAPTPSTSASTQAIARPTPRPTLPPGHPHPLHSPPSPSLLSNLQTLLASYHLLPAGSLSVLEDLVDEGMKQLSGARRGQSAVAEAVRMGRERKVVVSVDQAKEEKKGRRKAAAAKAKAAPNGGVAVVVKGESGEDVRARAAQSAPSGLPDYNQPMPLKFVEQTGLEKDEALGRREERRAVKERVGVGEAAVVKKEKGKATGRRGGA